MTDEPPTFNASPLTPDGCPACGAALMPYDTFRNSVLKIVEMSKPTRAQVEALMRAEKLKVRNGLDVADVCEALASAGLLRRVIP